MRAPGKSRLVTVVILAIVAVGMVTGGGKIALSGYESLAKADRLAAVSLLLSGADADATPVTFLDVDDQTRQAWGAQGATPHGALAELVRIAAARGAAAVLLDFDLTADSAGDVSNPAMAALLRDYPIDSPPLLLVRKITFMAARTPVAQASLYDDVVAGKPNIMWVSTLTDAASDRVVRRIRVWQSICDGASGTAYASAALAIAGSVLDGGKNRAPLQAFLDAKVTEDCGGAESNPPAWPKSRQHAVQVPFVVGNDTDSPARLRIVSDGKPTVALRRISAGHLVTFDGATARQAGEIDSDPFQGRVAIVGGSYSDSRDFYQTPLGLMPGALVLANSIVQARVITETAAASPLAESILALAIFLIFAIIARYLVLPFAVLTIGIGSVVGLWVFAHMFGFESGFDIIAMALTGFALFRLVDSLAQIIMDIPKKGWRVVLKS